MDFSMDFHGGYPGGSRLVIANRALQGCSKRLQKGHPNLLAQGFRKDGARLPIADVTGQEFVHHDRGPPGPRKYFAADSEAQKR